MENIKRLSDSELLALTREIASSERRIHLDLIHHLREVERRRLFAELGFSSLFAYVVQDLGYTGGSAQRRIDAMRLLRDLDEPDRVQVEKAIQDASLSVDTLAQVQCFFRAEKKLDQPKTYDSEGKKELLDQLKGKSTLECERLLASISPHAIRQERERALDETHTEIRFVADAELLEKFSKLQNLIAHRKIQGRVKEGYAGLFHFLADQVLAKLDPEKARSEKRSEQPADEKKSPQSLPVPEVQRKAIPVATRRLVWKRDQGRCTFISPLTGVRFEATFALEVDHIAAHALGGSSKLENLRLLCRQHNLSHAFQTFGPDIMNHYVRQG